MLERLEPFEPELELHPPRRLLPDLAAVHLRRLERLEGGVDTAVDGDARCPPDAHLAVLDADSGRSDPDLEARPQEERPVEMRRAPVVEGVEPDIVEVIDPESPDV